MSAEGTTYPCILRSVAWPAAKQACTRLEPALFGSGTAAKSEAAKGLITTPSTSCPTPRSPASPLTLPAPVNIPEPSLASGDVQPFWWCLSEGDEGVLGSPSDESERPGHLSSHGFHGSTAGAFGSLGLPDWVFEGRQPRDDFDCDSPRSSSSDTSSSSSPALSCFESPVAAVAAANFKFDTKNTKSAGAKVSWADLAEEEEEELRLAAPSQQLSGVARARVSWADLAEESDEVVSWRWS